MIILYGILGILLLLLVLLLIPVRYKIAGEMWKVHAKVSLFFGLFSIEKTIPPPKKKKAEAGEIKEEPAETEEEIKYSETVGGETKETKPAEPGRNEEMPAEEKETSESKPDIPKDKDKKETKPKKKKPSLLKQIRFGIKNGLLSELLAALKKVILHSKPSKWRIYGRFGTGDPASTGMAAGTCMAFLPDVTSGVEWAYLESTHALFCEGEGRVIPLYMVYIVIRLAVSRPVREFWQFRSGKNVFPEGSHHE